MTVRRKRTCPLWLAIIVSAISGCASGNTYLVHEAGDIQKLIDTASENGGGKVVVPEGAYETGSIQLKSNVELHLERGAILLGATLSEAYASFPDSVCSIKPENSSKVLVYAYNAENIALTGKGMIDGRGPEFFDTTDVKRAYYPKPPVERPRMVQLFNCKGIRIEEVTFKDSPCWTMFIRSCENIDVKGITVTADQKMINNDGIDFDGCRHVRVSDSNFKTCDDCLILRAMREYPEQHIVCEDVVVRNCHLNSRCQTVRLGCPSDDTIRDARFENITAEGYNGIFADYPVRYLRPDDEGYMDITDITFRNYSGEFTNSALQIVSQPGVKPRRVDGLKFIDFNVVSAMPLRFIGNEGHEVGSVLLENFVAKVLESGEPCIVKGCKGLEYKNVVLNGEPCANGIVHAEPGSNEPLATRAVTSWEAQQQKR